MRAGFLALPVLALALQACTTTTFQRGVSTPPVAASIMEAMAGGLIGGDLGKGLSARDRQRGLEAEYAALEYTPAGKAVAWKSDGGRWSGEVVAAQPYRVGSQDCRQYRHRVFDGGRQIEARGSACRNADGSWTPLD